MKRLFRPLALTLALTFALALTAAGCGSGGFVDAGTQLPGPAVAPDTAPGGDTAGDTARLLSSALEAARADLQARLDASPLSGLDSLRSAGTVTARFSVELPDASGEPFMTLAGTLTVDGSTGDASGSATLTPGGTELGFAFSDGFVGVSVPDLTGEGTFYGLSPHDMAGQLEGTDFAKLFSLDLEGLRRIDSALASLPDDAGIIKAPLLTRIFTTLDTFLSGREMTADGGAVTVTVDAGELRDLAENLAALSPELSMSLAGLLTGADGEDAGYMAALEGLASVTGPVPVTFTVTSGTIRRVSAVLPGGPSGQYTLDLDLYGDEGDLITLSLDPLFTLTLRLSDGVDLALDGVSVTRLTWTAGGEFDFITYRHDITDLALEGTLTAADGAVEFSGIWYSGERGDRNGLTLSLAPGGAVTAPASTRSIASIPEDELYRLFLGATGDN